MFLTPWMSFRGAMNNWVTDVNGNHVVASTSALTPNSGVSGASEQNITDALFSTHNLHFENEVANEVFLWKDFIQILLSSW